MDIADVRLLIPDTDPDNQLFSDTDIARFIALANSKVFLAAALALEVAAADEAMTLRVVSTDDLSVDGVAGAKVLLDRAKALRAQQDTQDGASDGLFLVFPEDNWAYPEAGPWRF